MELFNLAKICSMSAYEIYYAMLIMGRQIATTMPTDGESSDEELNKKANFAISLALSIAVDFVREEFVESDLELLLKDIEL